MATFDLVFEGGGAKGSVFVGALEVLIGGGHATGRLVGTSAGAITATLLAAGYTPAEMLAAVTETQDGKPRFASFMDVPQATDFSQQVRDNSELSDILRKVDLIGIPNWIEQKLDKELVNQLLDHSSAFRHLFSFVECGGFYSGDTFVGWLREKLAVKNVASTTTLSQLNQQLGQDLSLVATDTTNQEMLVLNHRTAPQLPVVMAVRMSMSIPFVWREVVWSEDWGPYLGESKTGARIVDGGVLSNFPIDLIATDNERARIWMGTRTNPRAALNLGLLIDESLDVPGVEARPAHSNSLRTVQRVQRLVDTMTSARDNSLIHEYAAEICRLPAKGYGTTEFDMPATKINALVEAGREAMRKHLAGRAMAAAQG